MGSPEDEKDRGSSEGPRREVTIAAGFWLFETACTQALWTAVIGKNPSGFQGADRPVENVSWKDAQEFVEAINRKIIGLQLSLPSEAQWEYSCRAGTTTPFSFGENVTPKQVRFFTEESEKRFWKGTVKVKTLPANAWGLYEMHGNVREWCADAWHPYYVGAPSDGSAWHGPPTAMRSLARWFLERRRGSYPLRLPDRTSTEHSDRLHWFSLPTASRTEPVYAPLTYPENIPIPPLASAPQRGAPWGQGSAGGGRLPRDGDPRPRIR